MILCPNCLHAVAEEYERCPFCSEELGVAGTEELDTNIEWKIIRTVSTEIEARLIAGRLQANGVPAFVLSQIDSTRNFTVGALAIAKIFVPEHLFAEAESVLSIPPEDPADLYPDAEEGQGEDDDSSTGDDESGSGNAGRYGSGQSR